MDLFEVLRGAMIAVMYCLKFFLLDQMTLACYSPAKGRQLSSLPCDVVVVVSEEKDYFGLKIC